MKLYQIPDFKLVHDTLRLVSNAMNSHKKETCVDRQVCKALQFSREVLTKKAVELEELEYRLILSEQLNDRYKQFIECEELQDEFEEHLELFNETA